MECSYSKCHKPESDRMVTCWLCLNYYHLKCSGSNLRARDADALADPQKFLSWTCANCRIIGIEFYNLFNNSKAEFQKINQEFLSLQLKFAKFGELYSNYDNLDKFMNSRKNSSPKQKKKNVKSTATQCSLATSSNYNMVSDSVNENSVSNSDPSSKVLMSVSADTGSTRGDLDYYPRTPTTPLVAHAVEESVNNSNNPNLLGANSLMQTNRSFAQVLSSPSIAVDNVQSSPRSLRVIPKNKSIFISRLASDTTVEEVQSYMNFKCGTDLFKSVYKFSYSEPRIVSSFKITVADALYSHVIAPDFWPTGTYVREFVFKERQENSVRLPKPAANVQKN